MFSFLQKKRGRIKKKKRKREKKREMGYPLNKKKVGNACQKKKEKKEKKMCPNC